MLHARQVYILGDIHGDFRALNDFINREIRQEKSIRTIAGCWKDAGDDFRVIILQCGDFAYYWPGNDNRCAVKNSVDFLPDGVVPVYWTGGNHDDWDELDRLGPGITEMDDGLFYCAFGSTLELSPDTAVLFAGGAESADKDYRLQAMAKGALKCWWSQEGISENDLATLDDVPKADLVISHTAPTSFTFEIARKVRNGHHLGEPSQDMLEKVLVKYNPKRWYFGHFHWNMEGTDRGCDWKCLNYPGGGGKFWDKLYLKWED